MVKRGRGRDEQLGMNRAMTRRDIVNGALAGSGAALLSGALGACDDTAPAGNATPAPAGELRDAFTGYGGIGDYATSNGDTKPVMQAAHRIRDNTLGELPEAGEVQEVDLVIIGGGPAGLLAAYEYRKLTGGTKTCLILENHPVFGGAAKQNDFLVDGVRLTGPQASNDFGVPREGSGSQMDELFTEFGLPRDYSFATLDPSLKDIRFSWDNYTNMDGIGENLVDVGYYFTGADGADAPYIENNIWTDDLARTPFAPEIRRQLLAWRANEGGTEGLSEAELDTMSYRDFLEGVKGYDPAVTRVARPHIGLLSGLSPEAVSARLGTHYVMQLTRQLPSFPGGNAGLVRPLVAKLFPGSIADGSLQDMLMAPIDFTAFDRAGQATRLRLGATVVRVGHEGNDPAAGHINLVYTRGGRLYRVTAKAAVMASGGWVNRRILTDMPGEIAAAYDEFTHAPALVANVALRNWRPLYDLGVSSLRWFDDTGMFGFCGNIRAPMEIGEGTMPLHPDRPAVFTLYTGLYTPGMSDARALTIANRMALYQTSYADFERMIRSQMADMLSPYGFDPARDIAGIVLNRWGHARVTQPPGFYLGRNGQPSPLKVVERGYGRIIIAHSELNGAQNCSGAFRQGARAAREAAALT